MRAYIGLVLKYPGALTQRHVTPGSRKQTLWDALLPKVQQSVLLSTLEVPVIPNDFLFSPPAH